MNPVRFALVGYGRWGTNHAAAIQRTPGAELAAVVTRTAASAERARQMLGPDVAVTTSFDEVVERRDVDVVDLVVPNRLHAALATRALAAGKHLLLEKPMALSEADCDRIIAAARASGRVLYVGHELRVSPLWGRIQALLAGQAIGRPRYAMVNLFRFPFRGGSDSWRYQPEMVGSWLLEESIHYLDLVTWYLATSGEPATIYARGNATAERAGGLLDNVALVLGFPDGAYGVITETHAAYQFRVRAEVVGTTGALRAWWSGAVDEATEAQVGLELFDGRSVRSVPLEGRAGEVFELGDEIARMVACVQGLAAPPIGPEEARRAVKLCLAAERSIARGEIVRL